MDKRKSGEKATTPSPTTEDTNRILSEVLKTKRAKLTAAGTVRFIDRRAGLAIRVYYHGLLPREDISKMLKDNGNFIVRTTSTVDVGFNPQKCLSVRWNEKVRHFLLQQNSNGVYSIDKFKLAFGSVEGLVDYYHRNGEPFSLHNCKLITPISRMKWEFHHSQVELHQKLGEGMFGEVYSGFLNINEKRFSVAIKTLKCSHVTKEKIEESMKEARLLRKCHHPNIVRFYGVAAEEEPLMMIMEMVSGGSLDSYLEQNGSKINVNERLCMCSQAAFAIRYLHSRDILHRDIAARNCLYDNKKYLKLSDFGLSVQAKKYRLQMRERLPVRWMPPEVFRTQTYTRHADVWALGVLIWEIFNNAAEPYAGWTGAQIKNELQQNNYRMSLPSWAPETLKKVLTHIWNTEPEYRLTAAQAADAIVEIIKLENIPTENDNYQFLKRNGELTFGASLESVMGRELNESMAEENSNAQTSEYHDCAPEEKAKSPLRKMNHTRKERRYLRDERKRNMRGQKTISRMGNVDSQDTSFKQATRRKVTALKNHTKDRATDEKPKDKVIEKNLTIDKEEKKRQVATILPPPTPPPTLHETPRTISSSYKSSEKSKPKKEKENDKEHTKNISTSKTKKQKKAKYYERTGAQRNKDGLSKLSEDLSNEPTAPPPRQPPSPPPPIPTGDIEKTQEVSEIIDIDGSRDTATTNTLTETSFSIINPSKDSVELKKADKDMTNDKK